MKDMDKKEFFRPVIVLSAICLVVTALLALTYAVSQPVALENARKQAIENRMSLLPEADDFTDVTETIDLSSETGKATVTEAYTANNGEGAVFTVETSSFGGALTMMVGVDKDGAVTGVKVTSHSDTPGVGTKDFAEDYLAQYTGKTSLSNTNVKKEGNGFAFISGASVTGTAVHEGVYEALAKFALIA